MPAIETQGISLYYEVFGKPGNPPVLLLAGLGGSGKSWGAQVERFRKDHFVVLPDHRGTGQSTRSEGGYTIAQLAKDMASLIERLDLGPVHVAGTSTGGAIGQIMALDHPATVRSLTMASSFARFDAYATREFALRRKLMAESDLHTVYSCYALFLFSPRYARENPEWVTAWIDWVAAQPPEREIALKRIDMIMEHDALARLGAIRQPALIVCGDSDFCTPLQLSEEIAAGIPGSEMAILPGGHFIHLEQEERFFRTVCDFIGRH